MPVTVLLGLPVPESLRHMMVSDCTLQARKDRINNWKSLLLLAEESGLWSLFLYLLTE